MSLLLGTANQILTSDGTDASWSSDIRVTNAAITNKFNTGIVTQTISSGSVTYSCGHMRLDTEGGLATDDLDTITGGTVGDRVVLRISSSLRNVVIKDGTGNIQLFDNRDILLDFTIDSIELIYDGTNWIAINRIDSDFAASFNANGYTYLPNGLIFQWGSFYYTGGVNGSQNISLPISFPTAHRQTLITPIDYSTSGSIAIPAVPAVGLSNFTIRSGINNWNYRFWSIGY